MLQNGVSQQGRSEITDCEADNSSRTLLTILWSSNSMNTRRIFRVIVLTALCGPALPFALLGPDWIELRLGMSPDNGSGLFEALLAAGALAIAVVILVGLGRVRRARGIRAQHGCTNQRADSIG